ncbi:GNAT family N-acetyltransferase [Micromonospora echinofusca]|uniref:GNAT family N-acetyltransferase n=1 Tax=Micromonospora echinofusca TaxID=47858 RepID=A0ABS3VJA1_MICEH|nr:GNAT family N-acetyltransferase [Micromonospora echinofusca]MBO4204610.1 GNAT family N-acetyltransferase [Micromonospora echinofusca]
MTGSVTYRSATPADVPSLLATWAESFAGADVGLLWARDPGRLPRTFVAVRDAEVLAAVYYLPRRVRDAAGHVDLVGGVANVATRPSARGQGHVRRLLDLAGAAMAADGCAWSLLFTGTPEVYRSSGFRSFTLDYRSGRPVRPAAPLVPGWSVRPAPLADWPEIAPVHRAFNARRPLSTVRTADDWGRRVPFWYAPPAELLVARQHGQVGGYLVTQRSDDRLRVAEAAVWPGQEDALAALFAAVAARAGSAGVTCIEARLPADPAIELALPCLLTDPVTETDTTGMVRPVHATPEHLTALLTAPGAFHWPGDYL